jgi:hypothetical protein
MCGCKYRKENSQMRLDFERQRKDTEAMELKTVGQIMETFIFKDSLTYFSNYFL